ncbi:MAG TPA: large exoprotein [Microbacterium sp.]|nr:large exoprotein [Microbacterium sp.]
MYDDYDGIGAWLAFVLIFLPILILFAIAGYVIGSFFLMKIFEKAGVQGKWRAWVPVYNAMILAKLGDFSPWVMLGAIVGSSVLSQVPVIGWLLSLAALVVGVAVGWRVGQKLGKEWYLLLLWLIPGVGILIWLGILAFGSSRWNPALPPAPWARTSWLTDTTVWDGIPVQPGAGVAPAAGAGGYAATAAPAYPTDSPYAPPAGAPAAPPAASYPPPGAPQPPAGPPAAPTAPPTAPPASPPLSPEPPATPPVSPKPPASPDAPDAPQQPRT